MPFLKLPPSVSAIPAFATDQPLSSPALPSAPASMHLPAQSYSGDGAASSPNTLAISADEGAAVAIINRDTNPDPVGYFGLGCTAKPAAENSGDAPVLEPPAHFDPSLAYLVITALKVSGQITDNLTIGLPGAFALDGSASLDAGACMGFPRETRSWAALATATSQFKTIFSIGDLKALTPLGTGLPNPGQILSFGLQGNLNLSLTFSAASLAGSVADAVNGALATQGPVKFDAAATATVAVSFAASDGFRLFAHRAAVGAISFAVKKDSSRSLGVSASAGLTVTVSETNLDDLINSAFEQTCGLMAGTVQSLLASNPNQPLSPDQAGAWQKLTDQLKLSNLAGKGVAALQEKLDAVRADLISRLNPVISAQFSYSWTRLGTESLVAQFTVPDTVLEKYHAAILTLNIQPLLNGMADGIIFNRLLGQSVQQVDVGYGFSFGLNNYTFFKSWDSLQTKFVELKSVRADGAWLSRFSFLGKRAYSSSWLDSGQCNYVELDATMSAPVPAPAISDFRSGLSVAFSWTDAPFRRVLPLAADFGVLLGAFPTADVSVAQQSLLAAGLNADATGDAIASLTVSAEALARLLPILTSESYRTQLAPAAMARALPFAAAYPERTRVDRRTSVYAGVFAEFLGTTELTIDTVARLCGKILPTIVNGGPVSPDLIFGEQNNSALAWTAQGVVSMADASDLQAAVLTQIPQAFGDLAQRSGNFQTVFPDCVENFSALAAQSYGTRIFASMLVLAAMITPGTLPLLTRSVQLAWTEGGKRRTIVVRSGGA